MAEPRNPYAPPTAQVADPAEQAIDPDGEETFIPNGRIVPAGRGAAWIGDAWRLFAARPWKWLLVLLILAVVYIAPQIIPLGGVLSSLLWPFAAAGIVLAADRQRRTGTFEVGTLFEGTRTQPASLLALSGVILSMTVVFFLIMAVMVGVGFATRAVLNVGEQPDVTPALSMNYVLAMLIYLLIILPITAATYMAPALIVLNKQPAGAAMKMSFIASFKNILPGLVYGACMFGLMLAAIIPLGLGLIVLFPVLMVTTYTTYRDIFIEMRRA